MQYLQFIWLNFCYVICDDKLELIPCFTYYCHRCVDTVFLLSMRVNISKLFFTTYVCARK